LIDRIRPALRRWQTWVWAAGFAAAAYLSYLLISGLLTPPAPTTLTDTEMVMRGIVSQGQHGKNIGWRFVADASEISPDGYTTTYHNVHDATYFRDGKPTYRLKASLVTVDSRNQNYSASGGVHVWSTAKTMPDDLQTQEAYWNEAAQMLTCPAATRLVYSGTIMHTSHMTVNMKSGASQLGDTSIDYRKISSPAPLQPTPTVSVGPLPSTAVASP
jgi:hypothetical protein